MTVVGRFDRPGGRWYVDPLDTDREYYSVTSVLSATRHMPWLGKWEAKLAAQYAARNHDFLGTVIANEDTGVDGAIDLIKGAAGRSHNLKADVGSYIHSVIEALILDSDPPSIPDHLNGKRIPYSGDDDIITIDQAWLDSVIMGFFYFVEDFDVEFEMAEATVVHPGNQHAGTLDFVAVLKRLRVGTRILGDVKTGMRLGGDVNVQLAPYRYSTEVWLDNLGNRARMPKVDRAAVLHLRTTYERGYKLLQQPADSDAYAKFLRRLQVVRDVDSAVKATGRPLYPAMADGSQPPPLVEDIDWPGFNPYRKPLRRAGVKDLGSLACMSEGELLAVKGIGKAAIPHVMNLLAAHGMALSQVRGAA